MTIFFQNVHQSDLSLTMLKIILLITKKKQRWDSFASSQYSPRKLNDIHEILKLVQESLLYIPGISWTLH